MQRTRRRRGRIRTRGDPAVRKPIPWGVISLLIPLPVAALFLGMEVFPHLGRALNGYAGMLIAIVLYVGTVISTLAGGVCALIGLVVERRKWLGAAGLTTNVLLCLILFRA